MIYLSHEISEIKRISLNYGLRYSVFATTRQKDDYTDLIEEDLIFHKKEAITHQGFEPRITANFSISKTSSLKAGFSRNYQFIHLLSKSTSGTPLDVWQPSNKLIKPQRGDQVSMGYFRNFNENNYETSVEVFYKDMKNLTDYKNGANILLISFFESEVVTEKGWAKGVEFMFNKNLGKLNGWVGYSHSRSIKNLLI